MQKADDYINSRILEEKERNCMLRRVRGQEGEE